MPLKFKRDGDGQYLATLPGGDAYRVKRVQRILLGRFGGGTIHNFWEAAFIPAGSASFATGTKLLIGGKWSPNEFRSPLSDTKKLAVIACQAHADGAKNEKEG